MMREILPSLYGSGISDVLVTIGVLLGCFVLLFGAVYVISRAWHAAKHQSWRDSLTDLLKRKQVNEDGDEDRTT